MEKAKRLTSSQTKQKQFSNRPIVDFLINATTAAVITSPTWTRKNAVAAAHLFTPLGKIQFSWIEHKNSGCWNPRITRWLWILLTVKYWLGGGFTSIRKLNSPMDQSGSFKLIFLGISGFCCLLFGCFNWWNTGGGRPGGGRGGGGGEGGIRIFSISNGTLASFSNSICQKKYISHCVHLFQFPPIGLGFVFWCNPSLSSLSTESFESIVFRLNVPWWIAW